MHCTSAWALAQKAIVPLAAEIVARGGGSWGFGGLRAWLSTAGHIHERYQTRIVGQVGLVHGLERSENAKYMLGAYVYKWISSPNWQFRVLYTSADMLLPGDGDETTRELSARLAKWTRPFFPGHLPRANVGWTSSSSGSECQQRLSAAARRFSLWFGLFERAAPMADSSGTQCISGCDAHAGAITPESCSQLIIWRPGAARAKQTNSLWSTCLPRRINRLFHHMFVNDTLFFFLNRPWHQSPAPPLYVCVCVCAWWVRRKMWMGPVYMQVQRNRLFIMTIWICNAALKM